MVYIGTGSQRVFFKSVVLGTKDSQVAPASEDTGPDYDANVEET